MSAILHRGDLEDLPEELRRLARKLEEEGVPFEVMDAAEALAAGLGPEALAFHRRRWGHQRTIVARTRDGGRVIAVFHLQPEDL